MTKEEMMMQMKNLLGLQRKAREMEQLAASEACPALPAAAKAEIAEVLEELAEMFCDSAVLISHISDILIGKDDPWDLDEDDEWDDEGEDYVAANPLVIFAVPGMPVQLMPEDEALSRFPGYDTEQGFLCYQIQENLVLHFMDHAWETDEDITITAPVFIARVSEDETENEELTMKDFFAAVAFLSEHGITIENETGKTYEGYWLPAEAKED